MLCGTVRCCSFICCSEARPRDKSAVDGLLSARFIMSDVMLSSDKKLRSGSVRRPKISRRSARCFSQI